MYIDSTLTNGVSEMLENRSKTELSLLLLINSLGRTYRRLINRVLAGQGLSDAQALPVIFIARLGEGLRPGVLAEHLAIEGPSLVRQLDQLCASGLVERRDDAKDRRAKCLYLTPSGRALATKIESLLSECRAKVLGPITDDELATAFRVLSTLNENVELTLRSGKSALMDSGDDQN